MLQDPDWSFGAQLAAYRSRSQRTQAEVADRAGCATNYVSKLEQGIRLPHISMAIRLADALELDGREREAFLDLVRRSKSSIIAGHFPALVPAIERPELMAPPVPLTPLIGRAADLATAAKLIRSGETRLLTITGVAGVGKTHFALTLAQELSPDFADGAVYLDLAARTSAAQLAPMIAQALGLAAGKAGPTPTKLATALRHRRLLFLLDTVDQIGDGAALIVDLLRQCPQLVIITTSQGIFPAQSAHAWPLAPLAVPPATALLTVDEALSFAAIRLFVVAGSRHLPTFQFAARHVAAVVAICRRLEGLPLAIELVATHLRDATPIALLEDLERAERRPGRQQSYQPLRDLPVRHQSLAAAIDWSYMRLAPDEQRLLHAIAAFPGGCQRTALIAAAAASGLKPDDMREGLASLMTASLVTSRDDADGERRSVLPQMVRDFCLAQLPQDDAAGAVQRAIVRYYLERLRLATQASGQYTFIASYDILFSEGELDNVMAAIQWAVGEELQELATLVHSLPTQAAGLLETAIQDRLFMPGVRTALTPGDHQVAGSWLQYYSDLAVTHHDYDLSTRLSILGLEHHRQHGDPHIIANRLARLARKWLDAGQPERAADAILGHQEVAQRSGNRDDIADATFNLGIVRLYQDNEAEGSRLVAEGADLYARSDNPWSQYWSSTMLDLPSLFYFKRRPLFDYALYAQNYEISLVQGEPYGCIEMLHRMADVSWFQGDHDRTYEAYRQSIHLRIANYVRDGMVADLYLDAPPWGHRELVEEARRKLREAIVLYMAIQIDGHQGDARVFLKIHAQDSFVLNSARWDYQQRFEQAIHGRSSFARPLDGLDYDGDAPERLAHYRRVAGVTRRTLDAITFAECLEGLARITPDPDYPGAEPLSAALPLPHFACARPYGRLLELCRRLGEDAPLLRQLVGPPRTEVDRLDEQGIEGFMYLMIPPPFYQVP